MAVVTLLYFDGCPNWQLADERLRALQSEAGFTLEHHQVETPEEAARVGFAGSPTVLVGGPLLVAARCGMATRPTAQDVSTLAVSRRMRRAMRSAAASRSRSRS